MNMRVKRTYMRLDGTLRCTLRRSGNMSISSMTEELAAYTLGREARGQSHLWQLASHDPSPVVSRYMQYSVVQVYLWTFNVFLRH